VLYSFFNVYRDHRVTVNWTLRCQSVTKNILPLLMYGFFKTPSSAFSSFFTLSAFSKGTTELTFKSFSNRLNRREKRQNGKKNVLTRLVTAVNKLVNKLQKNCNALKRDTHGMVKRR